MNGAGIGMPQGPGTFSGHLFHKPHKLVANFCVVVARRRGVAEGNVNAEMQHSSAPIFASALDFALATNNRRTLPYRYFTNIVWHILAFIVQISMQLQGYKSICRYD
jgi:hypothetical protein